MFTRAAALPITQEQQSQLDGLWRAGATPQRTARKCQVILLATAGGVSNHGIAQQTGLSRPTILAARTAFASRGMKGICEPLARKRSRPGLTPESLQHPSGRGRPALAQAQEETAVPLPLHPHE